MLKFIRLWIGQLFSIIGSGMTTFALGIHVYTENGKVGEFGLLFFAGTFPSMIISPFSGAWADQFSRKKLMLIGDFGAAIGTLFLAYLFYTSNSPDFKLLMLGVSWISLFSGIQAPAFQSSVTSIVPKHYLPHASGMLQATAAANFLISPVLAGITYAVYGMKAIFIIDFATFFIGMLLLILTVIPKVHIHRLKKSTIIKDIISGLNYIKNHDSLLPFLNTLGFTNFLMGFLIVLIGPMILSMANPQLYGLGQTISAMGMMISSIYLSIAGVPKKVSKTFYISMFMCGLGYFLIGIGRNIFSIVIPTFIFFFFLPFINSSVDYFLRSKVEEKFQGRVFSLVNIILGVGSLISYIIAGPLADTYFEPYFLNENIPNILKSIFSVGPGRGIGALLSIAGFGLIVTAILSSIKKIAGNENIKTYIPEKDYIKNEIKEGI